MGKGKRKLSITLAFRCKNKEEMNLIDKFLVLVTNSRYSSVELIVDNKWLGFESGSVAIKELHNLYKHYDYVNIGKIEVSDDIAYETYQFVLEQKSKKVSLLCKILVNFFRVRIYKKDNWWDSELICLILKKLGVKQVQCLDPHLTLPGDLAKVFNLE